MTKTFLKKTRNFIPAELMKNLQRLAAQLIISILTFLCSVLQRKKVPNVAFCSAFSSFLNWRG